MRGWVAMGAMAIAIAISMTIAVTVRADAPPPAQRSQVYSGYEEETIAVQLEALHATRDPSPESKWVERVDVVPLEVFEARDPAPGWLNIFHATTRPAVIRSEMLVHEGDRYQQALVDETLRDLRRLPELSLVLVIAARGSAPDRVRVVVVTKDVWSLRASWNLVATGGGIEQFLLAPTETNLLGTHQTVRATFVLEPSTTTFGLGYTLPRIDVSHVVVVAAGDVVVNRQTGLLEGTYGSLVAGEPVTSALTRWSWDATVSWQDVVLRRYVDARPSVYIDAVTGESVPYQYRSREAAALYEVTRSFGWRDKHDITLAAVGDRHQYRASIPGASLQTINDFTTSQMPRSDTRVGPSLQYHAYAKRYLRVVDFDTLALQEDFQLGHDILLGAFPSFRALGASRDVVRLRAAVQYTLAVEDGLMRASLSSVVEPELDKAGAPVVDASIVPAAYLATPTVAGLGRFVVDGTFVSRWRNSLNQHTYLGGDTRLRGFPTSFFVGKDWFAYNVEFRKRPIQILSCQLAAVAFYDGGYAFDGWSNAKLFQSVGVGLRALFPQLDRLVFRADLGFPLERLDPATGRSIPPLGFLVSFGQAFPVSTVAPSPVLPTGQ